MRPVSPPPSSPNLGAHTPASTSLPVLDAGSAMELMDNSSELYLELAKAYVAELQQFPGKTEAELNGADLVQATRTLHTFKGLSLTLGAKHMSEVCRQCELRLKSLVQAGVVLPEGDRVQMVGAVREGVDLTLRALDQTITSLSTPLSLDPVAAPEAPSVDALPDLQSLKHFLAQSDLQALDCFHALRTQHTGLRAELFALETALNAFDFSQAVVQCDELIRRIGSLK